MRTKPYTERGIRRLKCSRVGCTNQARYQWQICADGNQYRRVCAECDVEINSMVLAFMGWPDAARKARDYAKRVLSS